MDWKDVERRLCEEAEGVCRHLLPNGRKEGAEWVCGSMAGEEGRSLKVNLGGKVGVWRDFAGDKGGKTLMSLWCSVRQAEFKVCIKEAKGFLGIRDGFEGRFHRAAGSQSLVTSTATSKESGLGNVRGLREGGAVWRYLTEVRRLDGLALDGYGVGESLDGRAIVYRYFVTETEGDEEALWSGEWGVGSAESGAGKEGARAGASWLKFEGLERREGKKVEWTTRGPEKCLFGKNAIPRSTRDLIITEGEKDALAWATYGFWAVSVPFGAKWKGQDKGRPSPNREWIDRDYPWLENFETIFVCMDMDGPGQRAALDIVQEIGPRRCRLVALPLKAASAGAPGEEGQSLVTSTATSEGGQSLVTSTATSGERFKDVNECLMGGVAREVMAACLENAREFAPERVHNALDYTEEFFEEWFTGGSEEGLQIPFNFPFRIRRGELTVWTGFGKHGKTKCLNQFLCCLMAQGERACIASLEVRTRSTLRDVSRQVYGGRIWDKRKEARNPARKLEEEEREARGEAHRVLAWLGDRIWFYDHVGIAPWRQMLDDFRWVRRRYGVTQFVIDSLMRCGLMNDDYQGQAEFVTEYASFCMDTGSHGHLVAHRKKNERGERQGGDGDKSGVAGAKEITDNAHNIVEVWRNVAKGQTKSELEEKARVGLLKGEELEKEWKRWRALPDGKFIMRGQREGEVQEGSRLLWYIWESFQFTDFPPDNSKYGSVSYLGKKELTAEAR